jgi:hypothetical protein
MTILPSGAIQVRHGEVITLTIRSVGADTNFGVTFALTGSSGVIPGPAPFPITLDWNVATGASDIPGARRNTLVLTFNFTSLDGGEYEYTLAGDPSGVAPLQRRAVQAGAFFTVNNFIFHILHP